MRKGFVVAILWIFPMLPAVAQWNMIRDFEVQMRGLSFINKDTGYVCGAYEGPRLMKTTDGGATWLDVGGLTTEAPGLGVWETFFVDVNTGYFVTDEGSVYKTINGGVTWTRKFHSPSFSLRGLWFRDAGKGYVAGTKSDCFGNDCGVLLTTIDGGTNWTNNYFDPGCGAVCFTSTDTGYLGCAGIYKTTDAGVTWTPDTCSSYSYISRFEFPSAEIGYAIGGTLLYKRDPDIGVTVTGPDNGVRLSVYPVPATDYLTVSLSLTSPVDYKVELLDAAGNAIINGNIKGNPAGKAEMNIDLRGIAAGIYLCRVSTTDWQMMRKVIVMKP